MTKDEVRDAYRLHRGSCRDHSLVPPHWDELPKDMKEAVIAMYRMGVLAAAEVVERRWSDPLIRDDILTLAQPNW